MLSMSMTDLMTISVETSRIDSGCTLAKEFTILICMTSLMISYLIFNQVNLCHGSLFLELRYQRDLIDG